MQIAGQKSFSNNSLVECHGSLWLERQRVAGRIAAESLKYLEDAVKSRTFHSMSAHAEYVERFILKEGGTPTFKGYRGFPGVLCISINNQIVHGIPDDSILKEGDIVSFDLGVTYKSAIADTALTVIMGKPNCQRDVELVKTTEECLMKGIEAVKVGNRHGAVGYAVSRHARDKGFGNIVNYGGHHLSWDKPHAESFVSNVGRPDEGSRFQQGMTLCIEPMLIIGDTKTRVASDGWTVLGTGNSAHFEHCLYLHEDHVEIITDRSNL